MPAISTDELLEMVSKKRIRKILYNYENQNWYQDSFLAKANLVFPTILASRFPPRVCLRGATGNILFDHIQSIHLEENASVLGDVLTITCGKRNNEKESIDYTLVLSS